MDSCREETYIIRTRMMTIMTLVKMVVMIILVMVYLAQITIANGASLVRFLSFVFSTR